MEINDLLQILSEQAGEFLTSFHRQCIPSLDMEYLSCRPMVQNNTTIGQRGFQDDFLPVPSAVSKAGKPVALLLLKKLFIIKRSRGEGGINGQDFLFHHHIIGYEASLDELLQVVVKLCYFTCPIFLKDRFTQKICAWRYRWLMSSSTALGRAETLCDKNSVTVCPSPRRLFSKL